MKTSRTILLLFLVLAVTTFSSGFYIDVSQKNVGSNNFITYEFGPELELGPVELGITLTMYASDLTTGVFYFGQPSTTPSTNLIDGLNISSFGLRLSNLYFRYGRPAPKTFGLGFLFNNFRVENIKAFELAVNFGPTVFVYLPFQIESLTQFSIKQSDTLFVGGSELNFGPIELGIYGGYETANLTEPGTQVNYAVSTAVFTEFLGLRFGAEGTLQIGEDEQTYAYGGFAGLYGNFGILEIIAGPYYTSDKFVPRLYDKNYSSIGRTANMSDYDSTLGYIAGGKAMLEPYGSARVFLYGKFDGSVPILEGEGLIKVPAAGGMNGLYIYGYLYDNTPFENGFLDSNTSARLTIAYPVTTFLFAGVKYIWNGTEFVNTAFIGGTGSF